MRRFIGAILSGVALLSCYPDHRTLTPMPMPIIAMEAWQQDQTCAEMVAADSSPLSRVHWFTRHGPLMVGENMRMFGYYSPPDTIVLDDSFANEEWLVQHELLHYLMRTNGDQRGHPMDIFIERCGVEAWQHTGRAH